MSAHAEGAPAANEDAFQMTCSTTAHGTAVPTHTPVGAVYGKAAGLYLRAGFTCPLPLPAGKKEHPPKGYTGKEGYRSDGRPRQVGRTAYEKWMATKTDGNIALRLTGGLFGIDVDAYDGKPGERSLKRAEAELGELPPTYVSTSRDDGVSGIRLFRLPAGVRLTARAEARIIERFGEDDEHGRRWSGIDVIREDHRYIVAWPSIHPDTGGEYRWYSLNGEALPDGEVPDLERVPELPARWVEFLTAGSATPAVDLWSDDEDDEDLGLETPGTSDRVFTTAEAELTITDWLGRLEVAPRSRINDTLNSTALYLFRFAPAFIDERELAKRLIEAQETAWIASGGEDDGDYSAARKTIRSAREAARSGWVAVPDDLDDEPAPEEDADERTSSKKAGIFFTDARLAEMVVEQLTDRFAFVQGFGWMAYEHPVWRRLGKDGEGAPIEHVRKWVLRRWRAARRKLDEANEATPAAEIRRLEGIAEGWRTMCARSRRVAVVADVRQIEPVLIRPELFDKDPDILNTPSGVVDLRTGTVREGSPRDYLSKVTRAPYRGADYTNEVWDKVVASIPEDAREWVQVFLGQGATGRLNTEGRLLLMDGDGSNGKGALANEGAVWTLGDYGVVISENLLLANSSQHPTERMALLGARLTLIDETPEARQLDTQRLKKLLDQPTLPGARYLYQDETRVELTHTMVVMTNYVPNVTEFDHGTWRRLTRLSMPLKFVGRSQPLTAPHHRHGDPSLKNALKEDPDVQAACLAWLLRGAMAWYADGRQQESGEEPASVRAATAKWRASGDLIMSYAEECLVFAQGEHVVSTDLVEHFNAWLLNGHAQRPWNGKTFADRFGRHDVVKDAGVEQARVRRTEVPAPPSRPGGQGDAPERYTAWFGVRFVEPGHPGEIDDSIFDDTP